jgi:hypothetical protein
MTPLLRFEALVCGVIDGKAAFVIQGPVLHQSAATGKSPYFKIALFHAAHACFF